MYRREDGWRYKVIPGEFYIGERRERPAPSGWQPIETAPHSGAIVMLGDEGPTVYLGRWVDYSDEEGGWESWYFGAEYAGSIGVSPTHWQPLPEPPSA